MPATLCDSCALAAGLNVELARSADLRVRAEIERPHETSSSVASARTPLLLPARPYYSGPSPSSAREKARSPPLVDANGMPIGNGVDCYNPKTSRNTGFIGAAS